MNKTNTPYGDEVDQMKLILRFFSMNSLRASCLDAKREYIGLTGGLTSSFRLIWRS